IRLFRSKDVEGPYVDEAGQTMTMVDAQNPEYNKEYGLKMMGNYDFPSLKQAYMSPGHNSAFIDDDGKMYVVYHQRFDDGSEFHQPRVHQLFTTKDGWLVAAPFETSGETLKTDGYKNKEVAGTYYVVNHELDISKTIHESEEVKLYSDGTIRKSSDGELIEIGGYTMEKGTPYITIQLDGADYEGVFIEMTDEAGNEVVCFTAAGENNKTIWGVHYK
ncbi:MAG TPA: glycoside hydrolase family 43 protein, partial [Lachnospiraceae bacterium]|nr:glycoside hydrolase family 43 protein [Lachnospiraceae bacterium]